MLKVKEMDNWIAGSWINSTNIVNINLLTTKRR